MNYILIFILIMIVIYFTDKLICFIYCMLKSARSNFQSNNSENKEKNNDYKTSKSQSSNTGIKRVIKLLLYGWIMHSLERLGKVPFQKYRVFMLRHVYRMKIADKVVIYHGFHIRAPWNITIGKGTVVGDGATLDGRNGIIIGENVNISSDVYIYTEQHDVNDPYFESGKSGGLVEIGDKAWLSSRSTVLPKVKIGEGAVLASGAVATKTLDEFLIYGGIPAVKIGERNTKLEYEFGGQYIPFY